MLFVSAAFTLFGGDVEVGQKIGVLSALAVIGLLGRHPQQVADQREVEIQQERSVKEQEVFAAALGVAGEFFPANRQIGVAANCNSDF